MYELNFNWKYIDQPPSWGDTKSLVTGVLYSAGFVLGPALGAVFMSLSTIIVAINAKLLKKQINK